MTLQLLLAHGIGERVDLPVPVLLAQYGAAAVLVVTFAVLARSRSWTVARFDSTKGKPLPRLQRFIDSKATSIALRAFGFAIFVAVCVVGFAGENNSALNPVPTWLYVWLWVGLVPTSMIFGSIWKRIDPLPVISGVLFRLTCDDDTVECPRRVGLWPAALGLLGFTWLELVAPDRDSPHLVALVIVAYALVQVFFGTLYGPKWHRQAGVFTVYSDYFAHLSPWRRDDNGALQIVNPFGNLAGLSNQPGSLAVVAVLLGSTAFDGFTRSASWASITNDADESSVIIFGTLGLMVAVVVAVGFTFAFAVSATSRERSTPGAFAHTLIPIAAGYAIAHYFSLLLFQGQAGYLLASDPLNNGADYFGFAGDNISYGIISTSTIAVVQVAAIVVGHVVGVISAHDRSLAVHSDLPQPHAHQRAQYPLMTMMVVYTFVGIGLLFGA